jgi:hypothetical protein
MPRKIRVALDYGVEAPILRDHRSLFLERQSTVQAVMDRMVEIVPPYQAAVSRSRSARTNAARSMSERRRLRSRAARTVKLSFEVPS